MSYNSDMALDCYNYYNDPRVREAMRKSPFVRIDEHKMKGYIIIHSVFLENEYESACLENPEDPPCEEDFIVEMEAEVAIKFEVCPSCRGSGKMIDPDIDAGGLTQEDFDRDPSLKEAYFSGEFDITCSTCKGKRVVIVLDRSNTNKETLNAFDKQEREEREYERMVLAELAYGC